MTNYTAFLACFQFLRNHCVYMRTLLILTFISAHLPKREIVLVRITIALLFVQSIVTFLELWTDITFETFPVSNPGNISNMYTVL